MKKLLLLGLFFFALVPSLSAQSLIYLVNDADAIEQSTQHLIFNILKQQQYRNIVKEKENMQQHYTALRRLQQQVIQQLRQARSIQDLQWTDLSKSIYLADELINGIRTPGVEFDFSTEHPLLGQSPDQIYETLFIAGSGDPLPQDLPTYKLAAQESRELARSFAQVAAQRKAYAAVAFQYLAEDLTQKAAEMNTLLRQPQRFSMTEAERLQLQADANELLQRAATMLERADQLLLEVAQTPSLQIPVLQQEQLLERQEISNTLVYP